MQRKGISALTARFPHLIELGFRRGQRQVSAEEHDIRGRRNDADQYDLQLCLPGIERLLD
jgi:hypothetical protein